MMNYNEIFKDSKLEKAYQTIKNDILFDKLPDSEPIAVVLGGLPGAGKGNIYRFYDEKRSYNLVHLDCDEFRKFHSKKDKATTK